ncbi:hypothetical protein B0T17DRAFT_613970 [Bombardia bombarda]|uniref:Hemerythrin-like domain-containing protein n=1 Tax=Bombardia bombarda TaxID=252184 RepID=A0AA40CGH6_9PEZI|nr:hypothetical protein B0T17DRAFT_613970 [Bombardia bombarda]
MESQCAGTETEGTTSASTSTSAATAAIPEAESLPPLTPEQFKVYNRLAELMDYFHDHFRETWTTLYTACTTGRRPASMTLKQFLDAGVRLTQYLETHHTIEETHMYPLLARKMPTFRAAAAAHGAGSKKKKSQQDCELLRQHQAIHVGMEDFEAYLRACRSREVEFELSVLKEKMDSWGDVLMKHLDQEVEELGAENMRKFWTLEEMRAFPF